MSSALALQLAEPARLPVHLEVELHQRGLGEQADGQGDNKRLGRLEFDLLEREPLAGVALHQDPHRGPAGQGAVQHQHRPGLGLRYLAREHGEGEALLGDGRGRPRLGPLQDLRGEYHSSVKDCAQYLC